MKFGIKELWVLCDTVMEIARENGIPSEEAVKTFLSDVVLQYNNKLGFQSKIDILRSEVNRLRSELLSLPQVAPKLLKLSQSGVSEQDIINIAVIFEKCVTGKDRESFVSELETYGGLSNGDGFAPGSAYNGEQTVSIHEIKRELIKPSENMESKLEVKHRLTGALSTFSLN